MVAVTRGVWRSTETIADLHSDAVTCTDARGVRKLGNRCSSIPAVVPSRRLRPSPEPALQPATSRGDEPVNRVRWDQNRALGMKATTTLILHLLAERVRLSHPVSTKPDQLQLAIA